MHLWVHYFTEHSLEAVEMFSSWTDMLQSELYSQDIF